VIVAGLSSPDGNRWARRLAFSTLHSLFLRELVKLKKQQF
jgi:hypothetical protein